MVLNNLVESMRSKLPLKSTGGERVVNPELKQRGNQGPWCQERSRTISVSDYKNDDIFGRFIKGTTNGTTIFAALGERYRTVFPRARARAYLSRNQPALHQADDPDIESNISFPNQLHATHYTRYPQDRPVPDASVIADTTVDHLISIFTQAINPR
jgi:hypothetical protein